MQFKYIDFGPGFTVYSKVDQGEGAHTPYTILDVVVVYRSPM